MKIIAAILLIGVFLRHGSHNLLAGNTALSPAAWFYILGGLWEVVLCGVLLFILLSAKGQLKYFAIWAMIIGILEGLQISVCRLSIDNLSSVPKGTDLCDYLLGVPLGATEAATYLLAVCFGAGLYVIGKKNE